MKSQHIPRKRFSQNFLKDQQVIQRIINSIDAKRDETVVEIGPGLGALTSHLLQSLQILHVIEIDRDAIAKLREAYPDPNHLIIHEGDAKRFDLTTIPNPPLRIVGNLPYHISTPILFHCLKFTDQITDMHFMLQREVVERICAGVNTEAYGRLSIMVQYHCQTEHVFNVSAEAFWPKPKVESAIIRLIPFKQKPFPVTDEALFATLVREAFNHRRKTLRNSLAHVIDKEIMPKLEVDWHARPEQLSLQDFAKLAEDLYIITSNS